MMNITRYMKTLPIQLGLALVISTVFSAGSARAEICAPDPVPAATLLVPYFEVHIANKCNKAKYSTEVAVTNFSASSVLARATIWTDWSVPVYSFDLSLSAYEVATFDLLDLLCKGEAVGVDSSLDPEPPTDDELALLQAWLTGKPSPETGLCASNERTGNKAVGYITIDNVNTFDAGNPTDGAAYFNSFTFDNVLLGDVYYVDNRTPGAKKICGADKSCRRKYRKQILNTRGVRGVKAVHIEAASGGVFNPGDRTFYGRYDSGLASDRLEPLPDLWHIRYRKNKVAKKYDMLVWREANSSFSPVTCGTVPNYFPMNTTQVVLFDEDGSSSELDQNDEPLGTIAFDSETNDIKDAVSNTPFTSKDGWVYVNFSSTFFPSAYGSPIGSSWVMTRRDGIIDGSGAHPVGYSDACGAGAAPLL